MRSVAFDPASHLAGEIRRVLERHRAPYTIDTIMTEVESVMLRCATHGAFMVNIRRLLNSSLRGGQPRCAKCRPGGVEPELDYEQVVELAAAAGFAPNFEPASYHAQHPSREWRCLRNSAHIVRCSARAIATQTCSQCVPDERGVKDHARAADLARQSGDSLLSTPEDFRHLRARVRLKCARCVRVLSIGRSRALSWDGHKLCPARESEFVKIAGRCRSAGVHVVTSSRDFTGLDGPMRYVWPGRSKPTTTTGRSLLRKLSLLEASAASQHESTQATAAQR